MERPAAEDVPSAAGGTRSESEADVHTAPETSDSPPVEHVISEVQSIADVSSVDPAEVIEEPLAREDPQESAEAEISAKDDKPLAENSQSQTLIGQGSLSKYDEDKKRSRETLPSLAYSAGVPAPGTPERAALERKLLWKIDLRVMTCLFLLYAMNWLGRGNITVARDNGLQKDLKLSDVQWSTVLGVLYVTYILFQARIHRFSAVHQHPHCSC